MPVFGLCENDLQEQTIEIVNKIVLLPAIKK